jgi:hypothetical protein
MYETILSQELKLPSIKKRTFTKAFEPLPIFKTHYEPIFSTERHTETRSKRIEKSNQRLEEKRKYLQIFINAIMDP